MSTVFFSWQSDRPRKVTRAVIDSAIAKAIIEINLDLVEAERPGLEIDYDTKGVPGTPDIVATILSKIEAASIFVADVTPIAILEDGNGQILRHLPNPNVLIELGYAKKALGLGRIIQVWNTALTDCKPEDLPFDMRGRRGPMAFSLSPEASKSEREKVRDELASSLAYACQLILESQEHTVVGSLWAEPEVDDPSIWHTESGVIRVNEPEHGSGIKRIFPGPRSYVRILPEKRTDENSQHHAHLLGMNGGFSWGSTIGGTVTYPGSILFSDTEKVHSITKRFAQTGEVWGTCTDISAKFGKFDCIRGDAIIKAQFEFALYSLAALNTQSGELPVAVIFGIYPIKGLHWPNLDEYPGSKPNISLQDEFIFKAVVKELDAEHISEIFISVWCEYRNAFSLPEPTIKSQNDVRRFTASIIGN